jgi:hypothetical protein
MINGKPPGVFFLNFFNALLILCFSYHNYLDPSTTTTMTATTATMTTHEHYQQPTLAMQRVETAMAAAEATTATTAAARDATCLELLVCFFIIITLIFFRSI